MNNPRDSWASQFWRYWFAVRELLDGEDYDIERTKHYPAPLHTMVQWALFMDAELP